MVCHVRCTRIIISFSHCSIFISCLPPLLSVNFPRVVNWIMQEDLALVFEGNGPWSRHWLLVTMANFSPMFFCILSLSCFISRPFSDDGQQRSLPLALLHPHYSSVELVNLFPQEWLHQTLLEPIFFPFPAQIVFICFPSACFCFEYWDERYAPPCWDLVPSFHIICTEVLLIRDISPLHHFNRRFW